MILTGKALEDFYKWYNCREGNTLTNNDLFYYSEELIQNTLILEYFDSIGFIINIVKRMFSHEEFREYDIKIKNNKHSSEFKVSIDSYREAIKQAIIKANEIYNNDKTLNK